MPRASVRARSPVSGTPGVVTESSERVTPAAPMSSRCFCTLHAAMGPGMPSARNTSGWKWACTSTMGEAAVRRGSAGRVTDDAARAESPSSTCRRDRGAIGIMLRSLQTSGTISHLQAHLPRGGRVQRPPEGIAVVGAAVRIGALGTASALRALLLVGGVQREQAHVETAPLDTQAQVDVLLRRNAAGIR